MNMPRKAKSMSLAVVAGIFGVVITGAPAAANNGADIEDRTFVCGVDWDDSLGFIFADCAIIDVRTPAGVYVEVLQGQVPDEWMDEFTESGVRTRSIDCWANYLFRAGPIGGDDNPAYPDDYYEDSAVVTDSVMHFTPDGRMTQMCIYNPHIP